MELHETELWQRWIQQRDNGARDMLIHMHAPWVRLIARDVYLRVRHRGLDWGDYVQNATVGLIEAANRFDPQRGVEFRTFARHRIRGAIFDGLRQQADAPAPATQVERSSSLGDQDEDDPLLAIVDWAVALGMGHLLDAAALPDPGECPDGPYANAQRNQVGDLVRRGVDRLPERERTVLTMHYFQHVPFAEVARHLGISKSRVSQIHRHAMQRLRRYLHMLAGNLVF